MGSPLNSNVPIGRSVQYVLRLGSTTSHMYVILCTYMCTYLSSPLDVLLPIGRWHRFCDKKMKCGSLLLLPCFKSIYIQDSKHLVPVVYLLQSSEYNMSSEIKCWGNFFLKIDKTGGLHKKSRMKTCRREKCAKKKISSCFIWYSREAELG